MIKLFALVIPVLLHPLNDDAPDGVNESLSLQLELLGKHELIESLMND